MTLMSELLVREPFNTIPDKSVSEPKCNIAVYISTNAQVVLVNFRTNFILYWHVRAIFMLYEIMAA